MLGAAAGDDKLGQVIAQMTTFTDGLTGIREALDVGIGKLQQHDDESATDQAANMAAERICKQLSALTNAISKSERVAVPGQSEDGEKDEPADNMPQRIQVINKVPREFLEVINAQFAIMQSWLEPVIELARDSSANTRELKQTLDKAIAGYTDLVQKLNEAAEKRSS